MKNMEVLYHVERIVFDSHIMDDLVWLIRTLEENQRYAESGVLRAFLEERRLVMKFDEMLPKYCVPAEDAPQEVREEFLEVLLDLKRWGIIKPVLGDKLGDPESGWLRDIRLRLWLLSARR